MSTIVAILTTTTMPSTLIRESYTTWIPKLWHGSPERFVNLALIYSTLRTDEKRGYIKIYYEFKN